MGFESATFAATLTFSKVRDCVIALAFSFLFCFFLRPPLCDTSISTCLTWRSKVHVARRTSPETVSLPASRHRERACEIQGIWCAAYIHLFIHALYSIPFCIFVYILFLTFCIAAVRIKDLVCDTVPIMQQAILEGKRVLVEGQSSSCPRPISLLSSKMSWLVLRCKRDHARPRFRDIPLRHLKQVY